MAMPCSGAIQEFPTKISIPDRSGAAFKPGIGWKVSLAPSHAGRRARMNAPIVCFIVSLME